MTGLSKAHYHICNINQLLWITFTITGYYSKYPLKNVDLDIIQDSR